MTATALAGWRVLLARPAGRASALVRALGEAGALALAVPLIGIEPPVDVAALDAAVLSLAAGDVDWVAFTSVNAVAAVVDRAGQLGVRTPVPADTRVAAVGPATAAAARTAGLPVDLVPAGAGSAAALAAIFPAARPGESVLLPLSDLAAATLPEALTAAGYRVEVVIAYRTVALPVPAPVAADLAAGAFDAVLLTSPSIARALATVPIAAGIVIVVIGAPTARAAMDAGLPVTAVADRPTDTALIAALTAAAASRVASSDVRLVAPTSDDATGVSGDATGATDDSAPPPEGGTS